jgi:hypothetical protein
MPNGHILELTALRAMHPRRAFYESCGPQAHIRQSLDPTPLPAGTISRSVHVNWVKRSGNRAAVDKLREIGWNGLPSDATDLAIRMNRTIPAQEITGWAAIEVFALLIHDLEGAEIQLVLPIGSGGDYLVVSPGSKRSIQAEISGIHIDTTRCCTAAMWVLTGCPLQDCHSLDGLPIAKARQIPRKTGYGYHIETLSTLLRGRVAYTEVPVILNPRTNSSSRVM